MKMAMSMRVSGTNLPNKSTGKGIKFGTMAAFMRDSGRTIKQTEQGG